MRQTVTTQSDARLFRQHDTAPEVTSSVIYRQLTQEWVHLHTVPTTATTIRRWARSEPALKGFSRPGEIVDAIDAASHERKNEILLALLRRFQNGQQLAGRIVLQAMLPKLSKVAMNTRPEPGSPSTFVEDSRHVTIAEFWQVMATYPVDRRTSRVASNLALDTLHRVTRDAAPKHVEVPVDPIKLSPNGRHEGMDNFDRTAPSAENPFAEPFGISADSDLTEILRWGAESGALSREDAEILAIAYLHPDGWGFDVLTERLNLKRKSVIKRCSRLSKKLAAAVLAENSDELAALTRQSFAAAR